MSATANLDKRADIVGAAAVWAFSVPGLVLATLASPLPTTGAR